MNSFWQLVAVLLVGLVIWAFAATFFTILAQHITR